MREILVNDNKQKLQDESERKIEISTIQSSNKGKRKEIGKRGEN